MNKALGFLALIFIIGGLGLGIVALATNNWAEKGDHTAGFFQTCLRYPITGVLCSNNLDDDHKDAFKDDGECFVSLREISDLLEPLVTTLHQECL